jgi:hypothetical protein
MARDRDRPGFVIALRAIADHVGPGPEKPHAVRHGEAAVIEIRIRLIGFDPEIVRGNAACRGARRRRGERRHQRRDS